MIENFKKNQKVSELIEPEFNVVFTNKSPQKSPAQESNSQNTYVINSETYGHNILDQQ